jgi:hypothetical protein
LAANEELKAENEQLRATVAELTDAVSASEVESWRDSSSSSEPPSWFAARRSQPWPHTVAAYDSWTTIYTETANGLDVLDDVDGAVTWANDFITRATR